MRVEGVQGASSFSFSNASDPLADMKILLNVWDTQNPGEKSKLIEMIVDEINQRIAAPAPNDSQAFISELKNAQILFKILPLVCDGRIDEEVRECVKDELGVLQDPSGYCPWSVHGLPLAVTYLPEILARYAVSGGDLFANNRADVIDALKNMQTVLQKSLDQGGFDSRQIMNGIKTANENLHQDQGIISRYATAGSFSNLGDELSRYVLRYIQFPP